MEGAVILEESWQKKQRFLGLRVLSCVAASDTGQLLGGPLGTGGS